MTILTIPHLVAPSTCYVNGLEDILAWNGADYLNNLLSVLGGMGEFAYLKFKQATPSCMVYWGANTKYLLRDLSSIIGFKEILIENKSYKTMFTHLKESIDHNQPVVAGALDMFYLHYYPEIYQKQHIPIHYILVIGYDDQNQKIFIHDCGLKEIQSVSYRDFEKSILVNVPGMSKKNTIRSFVFSKPLPSELEIARKGLKLRAEKMLHPPVKLFGIPAMRKLSNEVIEWNSRDCFEHLVIYATTPPHLPKTFENSDGMRFLKSQVIRMLGEKYSNIDWIKASVLFEKSGKLIIELCKNAMKQQSEEISDLISQIADIEENAYQIIDGSN